MKRIGIFGGTFNPPHRAHSLLAEEARKQLHLDKILFIPSAVPPLKDKSKVLEIKHRLAMAKIAYGNSPFNEVSDIEIKNKKGKSYTVNTLTKLRRLYKNESVEFFLILGIDNIIDFPKWKSPEKLFKLANIVLMKRPGFKIEDIESKYLKKIVFINTELFDISSTSIREKVKENKPIKSLVLPEIEKYIKQNNLYK